MNLLKINFNKYYIYLLAPIISFIIIYYNFLFDGHFFGFEFIIFYVIISVLIFFFSLYALKLKKLTKLIVLAYIFKLVAAVLFTYIIINRYGYGDFNLYYNLPISLSGDLWNFNDKIQGALTYINVLSVPFKGTTIISWLHAILFKILPPSIYGLGIIHATISFIAYLIFYKSFYLYTKHKKLLFLLIFFIPSIAMQSSFIGKDSIILLLLSFIFLFLQKFRKNKIIKIIILSVISFFIYQIRFYQGLFLAISFTSAFTKFSIKRIVALTPFLLLAGFGAYKIIESHIGREILSFNLIETFSAVYAGGSHMFDPYPIPFTFLQIFRPFFWEAKNAFALGASIESFLLLLLFIFLILKNWRSIKHNIQNNYLFTFLSIWILINIIVFSFDPNLGDLARRKIYIIPFLMPLLLVTYEKYNKNFTNK